MKTTTLLNNVDHQALKVDTRVAVSHELNVNRTLAYTPEIKDLHKEFPLLFYRDPASGILQMHAILGLDKDENLFVSESGWRTRYVPAQLACGPFSLTYTETDHQLQQAQPVLCFDAQDPRLQEAQGEPVFLPMGGESAYLSHVKKALQVIETGATYDTTLLTLATEMDLLEPVAIEIKLSEEHQINFSDYLTVNEQKLAALSGEQLSRLNQYGVLSLLYFMLSSTSNFQQLIDLKNAQSAMF